MTQSAEQAKKYQVTKDFKGVNTKANRTAISSDEFSWIENAMPIGFGNMKVVNNKDTVANIAFSANVVSLHSASINISNVNSDLVIAMLDNGACQYVNLTAGNTLGNIANASTFSNTGVQLTQWKNERVLFIDPVKGYKNWNGTNLVSVGSLLSVQVTAGGSGYTTAPNVAISATQETGGINATATATISNGAVTSITLTEAGSGYANIANVTVTITGGGGNNATANVTGFSQVGQAIATFSGRTWISDNRTVYYSAADSYNDFGTISAGNITLTDSTLHGNIIQLVSANNFLYVFGSDSINVFSDVRVSATTGVTIFSNTNISASIGSDQKFAIFPYFRSILFMNRYGMYALVGSTTSKISDALDGVFPSIDFSYPVSAGQVLLNNILCAAFNFRTNYYSGSSRYVQAIFFDKKWFFTTQDNALKFIASTPQAGLIKAYGTTGTDFINLYANSTSAIASTVQTALMAMGDPIRDKQALKIGVELTSPQGAIVYATVDNENRSSAQIELTSYVTWTNLLGNTIPWQNNSNVTIGWVNSGYFLYKSDAQQYGKYLGMTLTSNSAAMIYNGTNFEYELRARY